MMDTEIKKETKDAIIKSTIKNVTNLEVQIALGIAKTKETNKNIEAISDKIEEDDGIDGVIFCNYEDATNKSELNNISENIKSIKKEFYVGSDLGLISKKELHSSAMNGVLNYGVILNGMKLLINRSKEMLKGEEFALEIEKLYFNLSDGIARESFNSTGGPDSDRV